MEQGASLKLDGDLLMVTPRSDIYVRYLNDNRNVIADLTSELYGRHIKVDIAVKEASASALPEMQERPDMASESPAKPACVPTFAVERAQGAANGGALVSSVSLPPPGGASQADLRQKLYADPVVRLIFEEFDARLVELKTASIRSSVSARSVDKK